VIDAPATEARVVGWAAFKHDASLYFFWHGDHWQHNRQKQGERKQNVWANPITFDNRGQPNKTDHGYINGDGVLLYPGEEILHPDETAASRAIGTVQLANLRRGAQDHQYLTLARQLELEAEVKKALAAVVPRVFSDAGRPSASPRRARRSRPPGSPWPRRSRRAGRGGSQRRDRRASADARRARCVRGLPALKSRWAARAACARPAWPRALVAPVGDESFAKQALEEPAPIDRPAGRARTTSAT
jgi:hypothetical protein